MTVASPRRRREPPTSACFEPNVSRLGKALRCALDVPNGTARVAWPAHTEFVSEEQRSGLLSNVPSGDVLVSHRRATREHEISIVPNTPHAISPTHDAGMNNGRSEAGAIGVDAWLTEDQTHVVKIASNRTASS